MGRRTLASSWKHYERMGRQYLAGDKDRDEVYQELVDLTDKVNSDHIGNDSLVPLFVRPYIGVPINLSFTVRLTDDGEIPKWLTAYDPDTSDLLVHPLAIHDFVERIREYGIVDEDYDDFLHCRYKSFLMEIAKLPSIYILFLALLQRVAYLLEIAHLEKRGGVVEVAEGEAYHTLLWAFKELEQFCQKSYGLNVRAHYGISWYEAEWITGR